MLMNLIKFNITIIWALFIFFRKFTQPDRFRKRIDYHDISEFVGPGRFYGSRVDERLLTSKTCKLIIEIIVLQ